MHTLSILGHPLVTYKVFFFCFVLFVCLFVFLAQMLMNKNGMQECVCVCVLGGKGRRGRALFSGTMLIKQREYVHYCKVHLYILPVLCRKCLLLIDKCESFVDRFEGFVLESSTNVCRKLP